MINLLNRLIDFETLGKSEAKEVLLHMGSGGFNSAQMAAVLTVFMMRAITVEELEGFRDAMLELCLAVDLDGVPAMDVCGTGGDGRDTFNISTTSAFVIAGAGQPVAKHGNYGVSTICGSSTVMEFLGLQFSNDVGTLRKQLDKANICFLHAPLFHPAMKLVGPIRKELGMKTFFNMLGPMVNPSKPGLQMVGVFNLELARLYGYLYQQKKDFQFTIVHDLGGYDEISLTGSVKLINTQGETMQSPSDLGFETVVESDITGGKTVAVSAKTLTDVLQGRGEEAKTNVVLANAAMALQTANPSLAKNDAIARAKESIDSGKAWKSFETLLNLKN